MTLSNRPHYRAKGGLVLLSVVFNSQMLTVADGDKSFPFSNNKKHHNFKTKLPLGMDVAQNIMLYYIVSLLQHNRCYFINLLSHKILTKYPVFVLNDLILLKKKSL